MSTLAELRGWLAPNPEVSSLQNLDPDSLMQKLNNVKDIMEDFFNPDPKELKLIQSLLTETLIPLGRSKNLMEVKEYSDCGVVIAQILSTHVTHVSIDVAMQLKDLGKSMLVRSKASRNKAVGLELMAGVFRAWPGSENAFKLDVLPIEKHLATCIAQSSKYVPTVIKFVNICLGSLCKSYPNEIRDHMNANYNYLTSQLRSQISSKASKLALPIVEGCIIGLNDFLRAFGLEQDDQERREEIYDFLRKLTPKPREGNRTAMRAALELLCDNCVHFGDFMTNDVRFWYNILDEWAFSTNRDDHKIGWRSMLSLFKTVGMFLGRNSNETAFNFLLRKFKEVLQDPKSNPKEASLSVQGYGFLAPACRNIKGNQEVNEMLKSLIQRTEEIFFGAADQPDADQQYGSDKNLDLSSYLEALTCVVQCADDIPSIYCSSYERILVHLIKKFPSLPKQYHPFALRAVNDALSAFVKLKSDSKAHVIKNIVYQGVIESCAYPIVTKSEEELLSGAEKVVSVSSFIPFWIGLLKTGSSMKIILFDALMDTILNVISKLNFSIHEQNESETTDNGFNENLPVAVTAKDYTIMANLEILGKEIILSSSPGLFKKWVKQFGLDIANYSSQFPEVSGLYRLFTTVLHVCGKLNFFEGKGGESQVCLRIFSSYLSNVFKQSLTFEGELAVACFEMCLAAPHTIVKGIITDVQKPLERIFKGKNISLIHNSLEFLENMKRMLTDDEFGFLISEVLPSMKNFLQISRKQERSENVNVTASVKKRAKKLKLQLNADESLQDKVQRKILLFLGSLKMSSLQGILPTNQELGHSVAALCQERALIYSLPSADMSMDIPFDDILPRIITLAQSSPFRQTRVAACELLHTIVLFLIGKSAGRNSDPFIPYYRKVFPVMVRLAGDTDIVICDLYQPLLTQCIHWFTRNQGHEASETACLLDSIMGGLCDEEDAALRKRCAELLKEFLKWSIKQVDKNLMHKFAFKPEAVFRRLNAMWLHPIAIQRYGASLAFNACYQLFREEEYLVDKFTLEITVNVLKSIGLGDKDQVDFGATNEAKTTMKHLLRILKQKSRLFERPNEGRTVMECVGGNTLDHLISWLFKLAFEPQVELRRTAINLLFELTTVSSRKLGFKAFLSHKNMTEIDVLLNVDQRIPIINDVKAMGHLQMGEWIGNQILSFEVTSFLSNCSVLDNQLDYSKMSNLLASVDLFVKNFPLEIASICKNLPIIEASKFRQKCCELLVRTLDFILELGRKNHHRVLKMIWTDHFWQFLMKTTLHSYVWGFDWKDFQIKSSLMALLKEIFQLYHLVSKVVPKFYGSKFIPKDDQLAQVIPICFIPTQETNDALSSRLLGYEILVATKLVELKVHTIISTFFESLNSTSSGKILRLILKIVDASPSKHEIMLKLSEKMDIFIQSSVKPEFEDVFIEFMSQSPKLILQPLLNLLDSSCHDDRTLQLLQKFAKAFSMSTTVSDMNVKELFSVLERNWNIIEQACSKSYESLCSTISLLKLLATIAADHLCEISHTWYCNQLQKNGSHKLSLKSKLLDLLPCFISNLKHAQRTCESLDIMCQNNFPANSTDLRENSSDQREYFECLEKLTSVLDSVKEKQLLHVLTVILCREEHHIFADRWRDKMVGLLRRNASKDVQLQLLGEIYKLFSTDERCDEAMRMRILDTTMLPLLCGSSTLALDDFFVSCIADQLSHLIENVSGVESKKEIVLNRKIHACKLISCMYGKMPRNSVHSNHSKISEKAFDFLSTRNLVKASDDRGKSMSKFLISTLVSIRTQIIDGSDRFKEVFRVFQCFAYNAVIACICCIQDQEKFYYNYIFKENRSKAEMIWSRIVPTGQEYKFPLELDSLGRRKKQMVSIRQAMKTAEDDSSLKLGRLHTLASHYLNDSSLSQDISTFDFNQSIVSLANAGGKLPTDPQESMDQTFISLDGDDINDHECMAPLVGLVDHMVQNKIHTIPTEQSTISPPKWMSELQSTLNSEECHKNVRIFLLKLICNRADAFKPFASHFGKDILKSLVDDEIWSGTELNTLKLDLIAILLDWSDNFSPNVHDLFEKNKASLLLEQLIQYCAELRHRDIVKHLVEVIKTLMTVWDKKCFTLGTRTVSQHLKQDKENFNTNAIVQIMGIMMQVSAPPITTEVGVIKFVEFWNLMLKLVQAEAKQISSQAAEVIGMALTFYKPYEDLFRALEDRVVSCLHSLNRSQGSKDQARLISTLYHVYKQHPLIVRHFYRTFIYDLKRKSGIPQAQSIEMVGAVAKELYQSEFGLLKELKTAGLAQFLKHFDYQVQIAAISVYYKLIEEVDFSHQDQEVKEALESFENEIQALTEHKSNQVRQKTLETVKLYHSKLQKSHAASSPKTMKALIQCLVKGFNDADDDIVNLAVEYLDSKEVLTDSTISRLNKLLDLQVENEFLSVSSFLMLRLASKSHQVETKIYSDPLDAKCQFRPQTINTSWRTQTQSDLAPKFVETLTTSSQSSQMQSQLNINFVRATQTSLQFTPTQASTQLFSLTSTDPGLIPSQQTSNPLQLSQGKIFVGKRFVKRENVSHDKSKSFFAQRQAKEDSKLKQLEEERRGRKFAQVTLMRNYRVGELPDIQINHADVVKSLINLCSKDDQSARLFMHFLCKNVNDHHGRNITEKSEICRNLRRHINEMSTTITSRVLAATILDVSVVFGVSADVDGVVAVGRNFQLESVAILMLEKMLSFIPKSPAPKRKKMEELKNEEANQMIWIHILELFRSLGDTESVRGVCMQNFNGEESIFMAALAKESENKWYEASEEYEKLMRDHGNGGLKAKIWHESYFDCLKNLSDWKKLSDLIVNKELGGKVGDIWNDSWNINALMPKLCQANLHLMANGKCNQNIKDVVTSKPSDINEYRHFLDLASLSVLEGRPSDAQVSINKFVSYFLSEWCTRDDLVISHAQDHLSILKKISLAQACLHAYQDPDLHSILVQNWKGDFDFDSYVDLQAAHDLMRDRQIHAAKLNLGDGILFEGYFELIREANRRNQWSLSTNILSTLKPKLPNLMESNDHNVMFSTLYAETAALKLVNYTNATLAVRLSNLYRFVLDAGKNQSNPNRSFSTTNKVLVALERLLSHFDEKIQLDQIQTHLSTVEKKVHFSSLSSGCHSVTDVREKIIETMIENTNTKTSILDGRQWLNLASYGYQLVKEFGQTKNQTMKMIVEAHLKSISQGCLRAKQLFPNLMTLMEQFGSLDNISNSFQQESERVPSWNFLPWASQIISNFHHSNHGSIYFGILRRMAKDYPNALIYPYSFSRDKSKDKETEIDSLLKPTEVNEKVLKGLSYVSVPQVRLKDIFAKVGSNNSKLASAFATASTEFSDDKWVGKCYKDCKSKWLKKDVQRSQSAMKQEVDKFLQTVQTGKYTTSAQLADYCPFLYNFHSTNYDATFEIPGQYLGYQKPNPDHHVKLMCFSNRVRVFQSIRKPINLTMIGDNGKRFDFIVKCGEDLRQDQRIEQIFSIVNKSLENTGSRLKTTTYGVIPLTSKVGLIECLKDTCSYKSLAKPPKDVSTKSDFHKYSPLTPEQRLCEYERFLRLNNLNLLRENLGKLVTSAEGFFFFRDNFLRSHALHSILGWIMSIGDRHAENCLVSLVTGDSIAIDFGYAFGATCFLPIPELVPFRMTPQIQKLMEPFKNFGPVREIMIEVLSCIRRDSDVLMAALEVFIKEPTIDWLDLAKKQAVKKNLNIKIAEENYPSLKLDMVRKKLSLIHPSLLALEEMDHATEKKKSSRLNKIQEILFGVKQSLRHQVLRKGDQVQNVLQVDQVVDCLLEAATDGNILICAYNGWSPMS